MSDPVRPAATDDNGPSRQNISRRSRKRLPELTGRVRRADIPVLEQPVAAIAVDEEIPVLEETFAEFEKTIPVLEETIPGRGTD